MAGRSQRHLREIQGVDSGGKTQADMGEAPAAKPAAKTTTTTKTTK